MWRREAPKSWFPTGICSGCAGSWVAAAAEGRDRRQHPDVLLDHSQRAQGQTSPPRTRTCPTIRKLRPTFTSLTNSDSSKLPDSCPQHLLPPSSDPRSERPGPVTKWLTLQTLNPQSQLIPIGAPCVPHVQTHPNWCLRCQFPLGLLITVPWFLQEAAHIPPPGPAPHLDLAPRQTPLSPHSSVAPQARGLCSGAQASEALQQETLRPLLGSSRAPPSLRRLPVPELGC